MTVVVPVADDDGVVAEARAEEGAGGTEGRGEQVG